MILDVQPPVMRRLYLYGALEVKRPLDEMVKCVGSVRLLCYFLFHAIYIF